MIRGAIPRLGVPLGILLLTTLALHFGGTRALAGWTPFAEQGLALWLAVIGWAAGAVVTCQLAEMLVWEQLARRNGRVPPRLLIQLTNLLICGAAGLVVSATLFNISLAGAIATSSVIGLVIGFAVKSLISDTFSGIALNLDHGFGINDHVQILSRGNGTRITGQVKEINWRSTHLLTPEHALMIIPNTLMSELIVINLSKPEVASDSNWSSCWTSRSAVRARCAC